MRTYGKHLPLKSMVMFGGVGMQPQIDKLRRGVDILVATPGRLLDHHQQGTLDLSHVQFFVLDEADRMLDMGFIHDIKKVLALLPAKKQSLLFSATFSDEIKALADRLLNKPALIEVARRNATAENIAQKVHPVARDKKKELLAHLISEGDWHQVLVFTRMKHGANRLAEWLDKNGIGAMAIHGNKSQGARTKALAEFKTGKLPVLVATDIAARGIDIDQLPHVVNFELPNVPEDYVHRIGRTGRAGANGEAISLVCVDENIFLRDIEKLIRREIPRAGHRRLRAAVEREGRADRAGPHDDRRWRRARRVALAHIARMRLVHRRGRRTRPPRRDAQPPRVPHSRRAAMHSRRRRDAHAPRGVPPHGSRAQPQGTRSQPARPASGHASAFHRPRAQRSAACTQALIDGGWRPARSAIGRRACSQLGTRGCRVDVISHGRAYSEPMSVGTDRPSVIIAGCNRADRAVLAAAPARGPQHRHSARIGAPGRPRYLAFAAAADASRRLRQASRACRWPTSATSRWAPRSGRRGRKTPSDASTSTPCSRWPRPPRRPAWRAWPSCQHWAHTRTRTCSTTA